MDTLGSFDFYSTVISLDAIDRPKLQKLYADFPDYREQMLGKAGISPGLWLTIKDVLALATHEYTHFIDATSTILGLQHLAKMNAAYSCSDRLGGREHTFRPAKVFFDHVRSLRLPEFYTAIEAGVPNERACLT